MFRNLLLAITLVPVLSFAQVKGKCQRANPFLHLEVFDGIIVTLERGDEFELCEGTDTKLEDLNITLTDSILRIRKKAGVDYKGDPKIRIIYIDLQSIKGFGKADIDTRNLVRVDSLNVSLKSGALLFANLDIDYLEADVSEGCVLTAKGYADEQNLTANIKGTISAFELEGKNAKVKATSGGIIKINITENLEANASTGGYINYKGSPILDEKTSLGGKVVKDSE
ncbi:MAG: DUF2807 domain-containing protein [Bacteroidales bacterium]|nr:DUF2807 domain-containing protein [Bacteroidales bacterium]MBN2819531.1 DUF2807 domain-containing protein [Bacteroidales bacterium]